MGTISWKSLTGADWSTAVDWSGGVLPGAADNVTLAQPGGITIVHSTGTDTIASLTSSDTLSVTGGTLTVSGTASLTGGLTVSGGTLDLAGVSRLSGGVSGYSGHLLLNGATTISGVSTFVGEHIDGTGTLTTTGTTTFNGVTAGGGLRWTNSGSMSLSTVTLADASGAAALTNSATGTLVLNGGVYSYFSYNSGGITKLVGNIVNAGLISISSPYGTNVAARLVETGTIALGANNLSLTAGGSLGGSVTGTGTVSLAGGLFTLNGPTVASTAALVLAGGTVAVAAGKTLVLTVTSGEVDGPGTLATAGTTTINGYLSLGAGLTWANSGIVNLNDVLALGSATGTATTPPALGSVGGVATLRNSASGTINLAAAITGYQPYPFPGATEIGTLVNAGLLAVTGTGTVAVQATVSETGTIALASNALSLTAGGTIGGSVTGTGTVLLAGGMFAVNGPTIAATAAVVLAGGTIAIAAGTTASLMVASGEVDGPGTLATSGTTSVSGNLLLGAGLTWTNSGVVNTTASLALASAAGAATLVNAGSGTLNLGASLDGYSGGDPLLHQYVWTYGTVTNAGTLEVVAGASVTIAAQTVETGTISLTGSNLALLNGGSIGGSVIGSGTVSLASGVFVLNGPTIAATANLVLAGGTVAIAAGQSLSALSVTGGEIDGPGTFVTTGITTTNLTDFRGIRLGSGLTWNNSASTTVNDGMSIADGATFNNLKGGSLILNGDSFYHSSVLSGTIVNAGLIQVNVGEQVGEVLLDTGTVSLASATMHLSGGGTIGGSVTGTGTISLDANTTVINTVTLAAGIGLAINGGTLSVAGKSVTVAGGFDAEAGWTRIGTGSVLTIAGTAAFDKGEGLRTHLSGPGTLATNGQTTVGETDGYTTTALVVGGGVTWTNAGTVTDTGFIRVGDAKGLTASFVNAAAGTFAFATDDAGIGNNAILSPLGTFGVGHATFVNYGLVIKSGGTDVSYDTAATGNAGTVEAASGTLDMTSAITGKGVLKIDAGATLETNGIGVNQSIVFTGAGTLKLDVSAAPIAPIAGMAAGVAFDLAGVAGATAAINGSTLQITPTGAKALSFLSTTPLTGFGATVAGDGNGGTLVTLVAAALKTIRHDLTPLHAGAPPVVAAPSIGMVMPTATMTPVAYVQH